MAAGLGQLGIGVAADWPRRRRSVAGCGGLDPAAEAEIDCAASGTTMRFLSAVCALGHGTYRLDGTPGCGSGRSATCSTALRALGVEAAAESPGGCPPVIDPGARARGRRPRSCAASTSSQFASGLAMAAPCSASGIEIEFAGRLVSLPYLEMTRRVMAAFGAACDVDRRTRLADSARRATRPATTRSSPTPRRRAISSRRPPSPGASVTVEGLSRRQHAGDVALLRRASSGWAARSRGTNGRRIDRPSAAAPPGASTST